MNKEIFEKIVACRIAFLMKHPFYGSLATRLKLEENNEWCPTAATDGRKIYYNVEFVSKLTDKQVIFLVGHELLHVLYDHLVRGKDHNKMLSNIAADFVVNGILVQENVGEFIGEKISKNDLINYDPKNAKQGTLYDKKYENWSYEQVYEDLLDDKEKIEQAMGGSGDGIPGSFDIHLEDDGSGEESEDGSDGSGKGRPRLSQSDIEQIKDEMREAMLSAAQTVGIGNVPLGIRRVLTELTEPKMNWRQLLTQTIESQLKSDYTYMRLGRKSFSSDFIYSSMKKDPGVCVTLVLDTSGSITERDIKDFFSEVLGIVSAFASYKIDIICFDTKAWNYQVFTEENGDEIMDYVPQGGGGTDLSCIFEYFKENDIVPKQMCCFTDGEIYNWGDPDYCDTLFIVKNTREITAPYGVTVEYK